MNRKAITQGLQVATFALIVTVTWSCHPSGSVSTSGGGGSGPKTIAKTKYTCSNGTVEVASETTCGDRAHCEDLCKNSGGSGGSCASTPYFCSVAQP